MQGIFVLLLTKWRVSLSAAGWPATAGGWAIVGSWAQGGVKGWFRSMQSPADRLARPWGAVPVGIASLGCEPQRTLSHILAGRGADGRKHEKQGAGVPASCLFGF